MTWEHVINMEKIKKKYTKYWIGNLKGKDHFIDLGNTTKMDLSDKIYRCRLD